MQNLNDVKSTKTGRDAIIRLNLADLALIKRWVILIELLVIYK